MIRGSTEPRAPGFDVARALAILGMVIVNYRGKMEAYAADFEWLAWACNRLEGKPAALFVLLAGIGISLRSRRVAPELRPEQVSLLLRAALLFGLGILVLPLWDWDILHFYGVFLALAALWLRASDRALLGLALVFVVGQVVLFDAFDWWADRKLLTPRSVMLGLVFNGLHPVFPWMAFLLVGMWLGRRDLGDRRFRRVLLVAAITIAVIAEGLDAVARPGDAGRLIDCDWLRTWPRPARPMFVCSGTAIAIVTVVACIELCDALGRHRVVLALVATGQLAFTLYVLHAIAILVPVHLGVLAHGSLELAFTYALVSFAAGIAFSVWWRRRRPHGPLEGWIRRLTRQNVASRKPS